ncbi:Translation initiation factor eIF4e [Mycena indigotica]|uniref:Translation initiation factor eIF4e n=1 Tax=Mycena indigotica TaxID=2126181 RepID=A0A8H6T1D5_9AGAR|nr:Translation initiation factor eIF4e [Mycena indigotica]KAF7309261.1 Translation initiation factor eIF4e [Mycena indigotica]
MSTYFSNHSNQSRFLAISQASSTTTTATATVPAPAPPAQKTTRRSTSKHFSTSVDTHHQDSGSSSPATPIVHPLRNTWVFWFRQQRSPGNKLLDYEEGIKKIASFASVESFWSLQTHLTPPSALTPTTDYLLFHAGIARPVWEDPGNINGGKWILRLRKGVADRIWESLLCAVAGDMFAGHRETKDSWEDEDSSDIDSSNNADSVDALPEICGCTISVRASEDIVSLWNRVDHDVKTRERIRETMKQVLGLPQGTNLEYKSNNDSMQDKDRNAFRALASSSSLSLSTSLGTISAAA